MDAPPRFGLHACMLEARYPLPESLAVAAALGADSFEIDIGLAPRGEPWGERREVWERRWDAVGTAAEGVGMRLPSLCLGALWQYSLASDDEAERHTGVTVVRDAVGWARAVGATALLLPVGQPRGLAVERARANLVDSLRRCLEVAEGAGVVLALENVGQPLLRGADDLQAVIDAVGSPFCGAYLDTGNLGYAGGDPATALRTLGPRLARVHLKDTVARARTVSMPPWATGAFGIWGTRTTVPLGHGEVDWRAVRLALADAGYAQDLILELPQPADAAENGCRTNLAAARRLLGAV